MKTKEEKIRDILENVVNWNDEFRETWIKEKMRYILFSLSDEQINYDHDFYFGHNANKNILYDKKLKKEERCNNCKKMKDKGEKCWWCGGK